MKKDIYVIVDLVVSLFEGLLSKAPPALGAVNGFRGL